MGHKKPSDSPRPDQHTSTLLVRFAEDMRPVFEAIKDQLGQPYTVAARRALLDYATKYGVKVEGNNAKEG